MKKLAVFFIIIIAIICSISYLYLNYVANYKTAKKENMKFEVYIDKEIKGSELTTVINKAIDNNEQNEITKDDKGKYIDNGKNSINIDVKFIDDDVIYNIEKIYQAKMEQFLYFYRDITFKCSEVQYHSITGKVKYMKFEQLTQ